jgi:hypothetical protein
VPTDRHIFPVLSCAAKSRLGAPARTCSFSPHLSALHTIAVLRSLSVRPSRRNLGDLLAIFWSLRAHKSGQKPSGFCTAIEDESEVPGLQVGRARLGFAGVCTEFQTLRGSPPFCVQTRRVSTFKRVQHREYPWASEQWRIHQSSNDKCGK